MFYEFNSLLVSLVCFQFRQAAAAKKSVSKLSDDPPDFDRIGKIILCSRALETRQDKTRQDKTRQDHNILEIRHLSPIDAFCQVNFWNLNGVQASNRTH